MAAVILVRYGELALKSAPVRREFERMLRRNVLDQFAAAGEACRLRSDHGHLYVEADDGPRAIRLLRRVFGVTSVSEVIEVPTDRAAIRDAALSAIAPHLSEGRRFAVRARRTGQHAFTSQQLGADLGGDILERFAGLHLKVDLETPEVELSVEVRDARTYLSTGRQTGPGGLPLGVAGRVVALVDGPRGALGAYLLMKRGCRCALVPTPAGVPLIDAVLRRFDPHLTVTAIAPGTDEADPMLSQIADGSHADGVVLPLTIDEFASARERWGDRVIFSPTVGLTDEEVEGRWRAAEQLAG
ncbi:MAG TPA: THUMP domain-containing protein [Thermoplasmata archaeon]